jgi:hypothetical protein
MLSTLLSTPWHQFNPRSLMNPKKGSSASTGAHVGEGNRMRVARSADELGEQGAIKPKIARIAHFDDAAGAHPVPTTNGRAQTTRGVAVEHADDECDSR